MGSSLSAESVQAPDGVVVLDKEFEKFAQQHVDKLIKRVYSNLDKDAMITTLLSPEELNAAVPISPPAEPKSYAELAEIVDNVLKHSVRTGHPRYFNQLWAEADPMAVMGEWLATTLNCTMYTYEVAGLFLLMEKAVMTRMRAKIGWADGDGDGMMCPGGSICNMQALSVGRHAKLPEVKKTGMFGLPRCMLYQSAEGHYSVEKAAFTLGFGRDSVCFVPTDGAGRMIPSELERLVKEHKAAGLRPLFVNATAGTTVRGAYDPFAEIAAVAHAHDMWMHIDGAWGGSAAFSVAHPELMAGAELADSVTWDAHKMLGAPQQCAFLLINPAHKLVAEGCNALKATYLFQPDKPYAELDTGDKHIQCGRRNDVLKFWLAWQALGDQGYVRRVDKLLGLARYMANRCKERAADGFVLTDESACTNVGFYHVPAYLRADPVAVEMFKLQGDAAGLAALLGKPESAAFVAKLETVPRKVKLGMMQEGSMMCGFQPDHGLPNFWRFIVVNPRTTEADLDETLSIMARLGDATEPAAAAAAAAADPAAEAGGK